MWWLFRNIHHVRASNCTEIAFHLEDIFNAVHVIGKRQHKKLKLLTNFNFRPWRQMQMCWLGISASNFLPSIKLAKVASGDYTFVKRIKRKKILNAVSHMKTYANLIRNNIFSRWRLSFVFWCTLASHFCRHFYLRKYILLGVDSRDTSIFLTSTPHLGWSDAAKEF